MNTFLKRIYNWIDERVELKGLVDYMGKKYVPVHRHSEWYYFGGVSLFLFIIQVVTGILLLLYYKSGEELAFESINFIMSKVQFGWLIRSVHSWTANLFILSAMIHMFSVFFEKAYRKPREITWITGMLMFFLLPHHVRVVPQREVEPFYPLKHSQLLLSLKVQQQYLHQRLRIHI